MKTWIKALVAGAFTLMVAGTASAHGKVRVYAEIRPYYPPPVHMYHGQYVPAPVYYQERYVYARPDWRREHWRREQWRRDHWRHDHWRGDRCRRHHWH